VQYRGACCNSLRLARHHSAAVQPRNPVAAHLVDWFYVTSFPSRLPPTGISYPRIQHRVLRIEKPTSFSTHLHYAPARRCCQALFPGWHRLQPVVWDSFSLWCGGTGFSLSRAPPGIRARRAPEPLPIAGSGWRRDRRSHRPGNRDSESHHLETIHARLINAAAERLTGSLRVRTSETSLPPPAPRK